ncbi:hypothetical protein E4U56_004332 [Claviceps arundinis]|uniref:Uncharacterized protein n=1 Tax=Claviceps arundinis TaxID=1623583 RepID=A0A9P7MMR8_9HYPO|nr:hypothetical protein E4U56_004332 [Claviceps arundinis]
MSAAARRKGVYKGVAICRRDEEDGESEIKHEQIPGLFLMTGGVHCGVRINARDDDGWGPEPGAVEWAFSNLKTLAGVWSGTVTDAAAQALTLEILAWDCAEVTQHE